MKASLPARCLALKGRSSGRPASCKRPSSWSRMAVSFNRVSIWLRRYGTAARIRSSLPRSPRTRRAAAAGPARPATFKMGDQAVLVTQEILVRSRPNTSKCKRIDLRRRLAPGNLANTASRTRRVAHMRAWLTLIVNSTPRSPLRSLFRPVLLAFRACKALRDLRSPQPSCARHSSFYRHMSRMAVSANSLRYDAKMPALAREPAQGG